jgi:hypothetical protein
MKVRRRPNNCNKLKIKTGPDNQCGHKLEQKWALQQVGFYAHKEIGKIDQRMS